MKSTTLFVLFLISFFQATAQRVPVLDQITHPHNYYFRELYLPQLTSGPSAVAWKDNQTLIYSMGGSLWQQKLGSQEAFQITDGYDYQPDVSPNGEWVVFVRYRGRAAELMLLNLMNQQLSVLTGNGAVNLEPRWSPDGKQIAFVSTLKSGHFLIHTAMVEGNALTNIKLVTPDRKSTVKRYYYGEHDHFIHPVWTRDGQEIYFVSNHETVHGTGDIYSINLNSGVTRAIWHEETSWQARPDISPDGTRFIYASFTGRNWHQLWIQPIQGGYPFPLTYGEYDNRSPRWSPDGERIAFISNRDGNSALWFVTAYDGKQVAVAQTTKTYIRPHQTLVATVRDENGTEVASRISITDAQGKMYTPADALIQADDSRLESHPFEEQYFHQQGVFEVQVPREKVIIKITHGPGYEIQRMEVDAAKDLKGPLTIQLKKLSVPGSWWSGDVHVHMNYGGHYLIKPSQLVRQAEAEDLNFVYNLLVNKEQRIPDINYFSPNADQVSNSKVLLLHGQEFHTSYWGHMGLLHLKDHFILPDYAGYLQTAAASIFPHNSYIADKAHEQGALVGYVHPFDVSDVMPQPRASLTHALPVDAALKKIDYIEVVGFSDHRATEFAWYQLLNCGLRVPAAAGTDAMANYASLRGPVGLNRVYVKGEGPLNQGTFENGLKAGRSFVTNGPLVGITVNNMGQGDSVLINPKGQTINYQAWLRSNVPVDHFEVVLNGAVVASHALTGDKKNADLKGTLKVKGPGWLVVRAFSTTPHEDLFDGYAYATTNPVYISAGGKRFVSPAAVAYFLKWLDGLEGAANSHPAYRNGKEKELVLQDIRKARAYFTGIAKK